MINSIIICYFLIYYRQYEETKLAYAQTGLTYHNNNFQYKQQFYFRKHNDEYYWNKFTSDPNIHEAMTLGSELSLQYNHNYGITSVGMEYISESLESNSLGLEDNRNSAGLFTHDRQTTGFYVQHQMNWDDLMVSVETAGIYND